MLYTIEIVGFVGGGKVKQNRIEALYNTLYRLLLCIIQKLVSHLGDYMLALDNNLCQIACRYLVKKNKGLPYKEFGPVNLYGSLSFSDPMLAMSDKSSDS